MSATLIPVIEHAAMLVGQAIPRACVDDILREAGTSEGDNAVAVFKKAWQTARLEGTPEKISQPKPQDCPFILKDQEHGWVVIIAQLADGGWLAQPATGGMTRIGDLQECVSIPRRRIAYGLLGKTFKIILQCINKHRSVFVETALATILVNLLALATSIYSLQIYDRVVPQKGYSTLIVLSVGVVFAIVFNFILSLVRSVIVDRTATMIDLELSQWFYERIMSIYMDARPKAVGTLASQLRGLEWVRGVMSSSSLFLFADIPFTVFFMFVIYLLGGWIAIVPPIFFVISLVLGVIFFFDVKRYTKINQGQINRKIGLLVESIENVEVIKANNAEWGMQYRWNELAKEAAEVEDKLKQYFSLPNYITNTVSQLGYVALIGFGAYLITKNQMTMGSLIACSILSSRVLNPVMQLPALMIKWGHARAAIGELDELLSRANEIDDRADMMVPGHVEGNIRLEDVRFFYGTKDVMSLDVPRLEIKPGETVGLVGSIGSGKSTLLKLLSGLYRPSSGRIYLDGLDMTTITPRCMREHLYYLPQFGGLISGTLRQNLLLGLPDPGDEAVLDAAKRTGLFELIGNHPRGLNLPITEGGAGVSGGQRQAIGLTRMILAKPTIILLDEPTASMDSTSEANIVAILNQLADEGVSLIMATHKSSVLPVVDRLLVMHKGKLVMDGPRDLVLARLSGNVQEVPIRAAVGRN